ncbi:AraC family transcriptional regulator [Lacihabitans sp. LS3-19]|uniref:AraC family transcriptional regulator n=1 Tax=Lacihabitans sp. LS3-19 TaxID=2487335 RepID=UPI0020CEF1F1|nr:AraC family transcriptional regulator [Lacihabitans sp. LS3-19]MCP9768371.1 AraC family transcriptional regulator [Lacihabitans sp. LS3-19]
MNQFSYLKGKSQEISPWPQIVEFSKVKVQTLKANSFLMHENTEFKFIYVTDGKYYWTIDNQTYTVFPNDVVMIWPNQIFGSLNGSFEIGAFTVLTLDITNCKDNELNLGDWSNICVTEQKLMGNVICQKMKSLIPNFKKFGEILQKMEYEIMANEIGYNAKVNNLIDDIWIQTTRQLSNTENKGRIFPQTFHKLDQLLRENIAHPWTVEEMATIIGLGTTTFTEKFKTFSGFAPLNYLINLRISEAIKLLKNTDQSLTDIALGTGFYSSQHFSTTFKKLTGFTPGLIRKNK